MYSIEKINDEMYSRPTSAICMAMCNLTEVLDRKLSPNEKIVEKRVMTAVPATVHVVTNKFGYVVGVYASIHEANGQIHDETTEMVTAYAVN